MPTTRSIEEAMEEHEIDLTPLIDCFLMLIIFFACLEFRSLEAKLAAHLPKDVGIGKQPVEPKEQLALRIRVTEPGQRVPRGSATVRAPATPLPFRVEGHAIAWQVGPKTCEDANELQSELRRVARRSPTPPGPLPVVIQPGPGVFYGDVAQTVDAVLAAGFAEITFGGGLGRGR